MNKLVVTYRGSRYYKNGWVVGSVKINEVIEQDDNFEFKEGRLLNIRGTTGFEPRIDGEYKLVGELQNDKTWGPQLEIFSMNEKVSLETDEDKRYFLKQILTENQVEELYATYKDPFNLLENGDIASLIKVKGIGDIMAQKLITRFESTVDNAPAYVYFKKFDVTNNLVKKLISVYGGAAELINSFKKNPYILIDDVDGIGFIKADEIALKSGLQKDSPIRVEQGIYYILNKEAQENGCTWVSPSAFKSHIVKLLGINFDEIKPVFKDMKDSNEIYISEDKTRIALYKYYQLEKSISDKIKKMCSIDTNMEDKKIIDERITTQQQEQGFEFTDEQIEGIYKVLKNNVTVICGNAGCVDKDTEYFNGIEWKKISEYTDGDLVLQSDIDGNSYIEKPLNYIKEPCGEMYHMHTKYGLDQMLSPDHNVLYITSKGNYNIKTMAEINKMNNDSKRGFQGRFPATFSYNGKGINLSDNEIKLMCAIICDGSFNKNAKENNNGYMTCRFHIKKDRKKVALKKLFEENNLKYKEVKSSAEGYSDFYIQAPKREKEFNSYWYNCSQNQLQIVCDNIIQWDGSTDGIRKRFSSNSKSNAEFIQFAFAACGYRARISVRDRIGEKHSNNQYKYKTLEYSVTISNRKIYCMDKNHNPETTSKVPTKDGYMYCFETRPGYLILRRNGCIFRTCNCGKTTVIKGFLKALPDNCSVAQTSFSGQASKRMSEATGYPASTIHRLLGYIPDRGFMYDENEQLPYDVVILDECSMLPIDLFWYLIRAIKDNAKLIILGDNKQLPPIGVGNLFTDLLDSPTVPKQVLTKIHRQAAKSAIITTSIEVRNRKQIVDVNEDGEKTLGELQDLTMCSYQDKDDIFKRAIEAFKEEYKKHPHIKDIQIIVPMRERGELSQLAFNNAIQKMINPQDNKYVKINKNFVIKEGDKIINRKNNYKLFDINYQPVQVFNGSMGIVEEIYDDYMIIDFFDIGKVRITSDLYNGLQLAYAITTHLSQGSQWANTIVVFDYGAYILLSSEWVYTAITRASKRCYLVAETRALRYATTTTKIKGKDTFLKDLLDGEDLCL